MQSLQGGKFKCNSTGLLKNFSSFKATKKGHQGTDFYIYDNATTQFAFDEKVFTTLDIVGSDSNTQAETKDYYTTKKTLSYIPNETLSLSAKLNI